MKRIHCRLYHVWLAKIQTRYVEEITIHEIHNPTFYT